MVRLYGCAEYVPNLLTKFNPVRGFIRYFYTSIDVDFPSVPNLLTKFYAVPVVFLGSSYELLTLILSTDALIFSRKYNTPVLKFTIEIPT